MRVLFIQDRYESNLGIMYISSVLRKRGHDTFLLIAAKESDLVREALRYHPDVLAYSAMTTNYVRLLEINREIKSRASVFSIFGGPHATFSAELIHEEGVDSICRGEGEKTVDECMRRLENNEPLHEVPGLWVKTDGRIERNDVPDLIGDLDTIAFPDRHVYRRYFDDRLFMENIAVRFITGRGCPFKCTYCFNHVQSEIYKGKGKYIRHRSVDNVIQEVNQVKGEFGIRHLTFVDDILGIDRMWLREFAERFPVEVGLPFACLMRPNFVTGETARNLKRAGCYWVDIGLETGNDRLRNEILGRNMSRKQILEASQNFHDIGLAFGTFSIVALPGESLETLGETVDLNIECRPLHADASIFQPYPGTQLTDYAVRHGYFDGDFAKLAPDLYSRSVLNLQDRAVMENFHKVFAIAVRYPFLKRALLWLSRYRLEKLFNFCYQAYKDYYHVPLNRGDLDELDAIKKRNFFSTALHVLYNSLLGKQVKLRP